MPDLLDITDWKERTQQSLADRIYKEVESTQQFVIQPYPNKMRLTGEQYNILAGIPIDDDRAVTYTVFHTPHNVMELILEGGLDDRPQES